MIKLIKEIPSYLLRKIKTKKISYSQSGIDLIINYIFKNKKKGFYIDIGCNHPVYNNNTYLLYKRGWSGINIDLDKVNIDLFNLFRARDKNINSAIYSGNSEKKVFFYHDKSPLNTLKKNITNRQKAKINQIKKIKTNTLDSILNNFKITKPIDFVSIDVEGGELDVLKGFNLKKYKPNIIVIEFLDLSIKRLEVKNFNIRNVLKSKIYNYMIKHDYKLINWLHSDLIFANKSFEDKY